MKTRSDLSTIELTDRYTAGNYARYPRAFVRGEGRRLWDEDGKAYLDLFSGLGVSSLGHGHAGLTAAICEQAHALIHTSNLFYHRPGAELAARLVELTFADRAFFCNSGTEAIEAAIKMARRCQGERKEIITVDGSFHGRTLGALAATGQKSLQEGFGPMPEGFVHVERCDLDAIARAIGPKTAAVLIEPLLGEGGIVLHPKGYLEGVRRLTAEAGVLLILDEVQTGNGRTGKLYAHEHFGVTPDILATAKGLAGGLPIGAVLATEAVAKAFVPGAHGTTFGGNPVVCRAALAVLDALTEGGVIENAARSGAHLRVRLEALAAARDDILDVRGLGLMLGVEFARPTRDIVDALLDAGVIANATAGTVLRLLPPLTITTDEVDEGIDALVRVLG